MLDARLSQQIVSTIARWIVCRQISDDGKLPPLKELAHRFGVSVTTVREAIAGLQTLGIVTMKHGVGAYVTSPDTVLDDMYRTRRDLEILLGHHAAEVITDQEIEQMRSHLAQLQHAAEQRNVEAYQTCDSSFHAVIFRASRSPILTSVITFLKYGLFSPSSYVYVELGTDGEYLVRANRDHFALFDAMSRRDGDAVERAVCSHLDRAYSTWSRHLDSMCTKAKSELAQMEHYLP
jgi:GntR family transcriptional repressor for pyruvate dehydrogenase complex